MQEEFNQLPQIDSRLRKNILRMPEAVFQASGIVINGRRIKSFVFTTDLAIIRNCDADAVFAVYPFTPQPVISQAIISVSDVPVFVGVGGGITTGSRSVRLAIQSEHQGAYGVVLNAPPSDDVIRQIKKVVDIPVVITVVSAHTDIGSRLEAGADFLNVSGAAATPELVADIARNGIVLTGGGSQLFGMDRLLCERTEMTCVVADDADSCAAYGCGKSLSWMNHMQEGTINLARRKLMKEG